MIHLYFLYAAMFLVAIAPVAGADDTKPHGVMTADQLRAAGFTPLAPNDSLAEWDLQTLAPESLDDQRRRHPLRRQRREQKLPEELAVDEERLWRL